MTIEIRRPELEKFGREEILNGHFSSVDDLLTEDLQALRVSHGFTVCRFRSQSGTAAGLRSASGGGHSGWTSLPTESGLAAADSS
jgi:hypothetical protein